MSASAWRSPWTVAKPKTPMVAVRWRERRRSRPHPSPRRPNLTRNNPTLAHNLTQPKKHDSPVGPSPRSPLLHPATAPPPAAPLSWPPGPRGGPRRVVAGVGCHDHGRNALACHVESRRGGAGVVQGRCSKPRGGWTRVCGECRRGAFHRRDCWTRLILGLSSRVISGHRDGRPLAGHVNLPVREEAGRSHLDRRTRPLAELPRGLDEPAAARLLTRRLRRAERGTSLQTGNPSLFKTSATH